MSEMLLRYGIAASGLGLGAVTLGPNIMLCASSRPEMVCASKIGVCASASFVAAGVIGGCLRSPRVRYLGYACVLQASAFWVPPLLTKIGMIESNEAYDKRMDEEMKKYK